ncbi:ATP-binding protein [Mesorhizobium sp. BAC0120]|uniref:ATP-binding protein n=1 Tax=Mesorhizobium sp. BAC0120 TaxID=3090670 RepID=UPI00298D3BBA|nr:ATP-binding protein [Mesorhizobium sp. BAC0120]MDW6021651.1 ATP-binding protein [Mesorhizobium sp. BAC0120]
MGGFSEGFDWHIMIFVGGASGTGKTTAIERFVNRHPGFLHLRASSILRNCGRPIQNLSLLELKENQRLLRKGLLRMHLSPTTILDGHMTVPAENTLFQVPASFFEGLALSAFVLLWTEPSQLLQRRGQPISPQALAAIEELQHSERQQMHRVAAHYGCPVEILSSKEDYLLERILLQHGTR